LGFRFAFQVSRFRFHNVKPKPKTPRKTHNVKHKTKNLLKDVMSKAEGLSLQPPTNLAAGL